MSQVIIYKQDNGVVAIVRPTEEAIRLFGVEAIAQKDVPEGKPYKVINASELPADRSQRNAWTVNDADLTDGVGATWNTFDEVRP
jgi:hypothetical protein